MPRELPIILCPEMVKAAYEDRKTNTRRIEGLKRLNDRPYVAWRFIGWLDNGTARFDGKNIFEHIKPRYQVGDELWAKEVWAPHRDYEARPARDLGSGLIIYAADGKESRPVVRWRSPYFMFKKHARFWFRVKAVLDPHPIQTLSEADAKAEGIEYLFSEQDCKTGVGMRGTKPEDHGYKNYLWHGFIGKGITQKQSDSWPYQDRSYQNPIGSFSSLWTRLHSYPGERWDDNPYVFGYVLQSIKRPEGQGASLPLQEIPK